MEIIETLYAARNEKNAGPMAAYMRNLFPYLGIKAPMQRTLTKDFLNLRKKDKEIDWAFVWMCYALPEREFQYLALSYIGTVKKLLKPEDTGNLEKLTTTKSWWDTVDIIDDFVGELCLQFPEVKETVIALWMVSDNIWLKRISIDFQLQYKDKTDTEFLSRAILSNLDTKEFFVNKAIGWSLREYSKTNKAWVRQFIDLNRNEMSPLSIREASKYI